jgi:hypothetical protein
MGFLALAALGMTIQILVFGVSHEVHHILRAAQVAVFLLFLAEYLCSLWLAPNRLAFITKPSRLFDVAVLLIALASFLPFVEDRLLNAQALQILRLAPIVVFGYVGTREFSHQLITNQETTVESGTDFFRIEHDPGGSRQVPVTQEQALAWLSAPDRTGFTVCRGVVTDELAACLASSAIPISLLRNALSQSSFPRAVRVGSLYVVAGAVPRSSFDGAHGIVIERSTFVAVFTLSSVLLINPASLRLSEDVLGLLNADKLLEGQPPAYRFMVGLFKLMIERYELCALDLETELRARELEPLHKSGGGIYQAMYVLRQAVSNLKSDTWRLRHILHGIEEGHRPSIFQHQGTAEVFTLMCHSTDFLYETFGELDQKAAAILDLRINLVSFEMNKFMGLLAVVTAIGLIPATFGGLLGMNVLGINFPITLPNVAFLCLMLITMTLHILWTKGWLRFR